MKYIKYLLVAGLLLPCSCNKEAYSPTPDTPVREAIVTETLDEEQEYDAVVTVMQTERQFVYFQVDSVSRLYPLNYEEPYSGPKRLACRLVEYKNRIIDQNEHFHLGYVKWFEDVAQGTVELDNYALPTDLSMEDGIDLRFDWMTSLEDAFLTLHYSSFWGDGSVAHRMLLQKTGEKEFRLRYFRNGDEKLREGDALVCFDLNDWLPRTEGMDITLKWTTGAGESAEKSFRFQSRP